MSITKNMRRARNASSAYSRSKPSRFDWLLWSAINKNTNKRNNLANVAQTGNKVKIDGSEINLQPNVNKAVTVGSRKFQSFNISLVNTNGAATTYTDGDCLVELGALDTTAPAGMTTGTKIFIHKAVVLTKTVSGPTLVGNLRLSAVSGTATNAALTAGVEIVGAGVTAFNTFKSVAETVNTEIDINLDSTAGLYHIFTPNVAVDIAKDHVYLCTSTILSADATAGRYTIELEYSIL